jgi:DNA (cytosine-5)-methyltransferase 1
MSFAYDQIRALDLFAGTGWGVACDLLGIREDGVDNMPEVIATRERNHFRTPWHDIRDMPPRVAAAYDLLIASPPCQSFSVAGAGEGREALSAVLAGVHALAQGREPSRTTSDPRTWLVLEPLRFALAGQPPFIVWEQVPTILPVWQACERVLTQRGYAAWTGLMRTEQYGIPQTRTRAVLIATTTRSTIVPPPPTNSRYYERQPHRLDAGVGSWVSMQSALGYTKDEPWLALRSNYGTNGVAANRGLRFITQPAPTVTTKINRNQWVLADPAGNRDKFMPLKQRVSVLEAQQLQTYPDDFVFVGGSQNQYLQIGNAVPPRWGAQLIQSVLSP